MKNPSITLRTILIILGMALLLPGEIKAATGGAGSTGGILYVGGSEGVVGWAQASNGSVISTDVYVTKRGETVDKQICSQGNVAANQTLTDSENSIGSKNGKVFVFKNSCLSALIDGDYDVYVALGPNLFATVFPFTVRTLDSISNSRIWLHYLGKMVDRVPGNYDSYPTVMKDGAVYKMWYVSGNGGDNVFYATSSDGLNWNLETGPLPGGAVLAPTVTSCTCHDNGLVGTCTTGTFAADDMHTADPSVVKVSGVYYMYFTAASKQWSCFGSNNSVYLATSTDGKNWTKYKDTSGNLIAVMRPLHPCVGQAECSTGYGAGQSSVIYKDGIYRHYYTDLTDQTMGFSMGTSTDGKNFGSITNGVMGDLTWDIKYSTYLGNYFGMVSIPSNPRSPGTLRITTSNDGLTWQPTVNVGMSGLTSDISHFVPNNGGLLSDPVGIIGGNHTIYYTGAGWGMQDGGDSATNSWDIIGVDVWLSRGKNYTNFGDWFKGLVGNLTTMSDLKFLMSKI